ncbi:MAG: hypothetical protein ACXW04_00030 [Methylobacter sp.]
MKIFFRAVGLIFIEENTSIFCFQKWGYFLSSIILAGFFAKIAYWIFDDHQQYSELIVGSIAWSYSNKFHDYAMLFSFVGVFFVSLMIISGLSGRLDKRLGHGAENSFHEFLVLLSAPVGLWFAGLLTTRNSSLFLLELSGSLLITALIFVYFLTEKTENYWDRDAAKIFPILQTIFLVIVATGLAVAAIGVGVNRISAVLNNKFYLHSALVYRLEAFFLLLVALISVVFVIKSRSSKNLEQLFRSTLFFLQIFFPAFFLVLIPTPWFAENKLFIGYPLSNFGYWIIGILIVVAYIDLFRQYKLGVVSLAANPVDIFSTTCAVGVLLFLKVGPIYEPSISPDDYHFGEMLVPWWSLVQQHMVPFWDYAPARGLINYFPGAINSIFFDGKVSSFTAGSPFIYAAILLVAMPVIRWCVGLGVAALALLFMSGINGLSEIDILVTVFLCIGIQGFFKWKPTTWIAIWILLDLTILLYAPGQGALAILATSPLGFYKLRQAYIEERKAFAGMVWFLAAVALGISLITPVGKMLYGAIRYGLEQSSVNSIANGISWNNSFATADANPWLFEIVRASWLFVALLAGALILHMRSPRYAMTRSRVLAYAVPILILTVLFIIRASGRIDPDVSRLGYASIWALSLLLPLLLFATHKYKSRGSAIFLWLSIVGIISPYFGGVVTNFAYVFEPFHVPAGNTVAINGTAVGMPELGKANMDPLHLARLIAIRKVLDKVLDPEETYLDLTGRHATYFYFNRRPPIETGSVYNLVTEPQQLRAISSLQQEPPPAILISADNILWDGGPAGLRANLLYRSILLKPGYKVVKIGSQVWLLRADRVERTSGMGVISVSEVDDLPTNVIHEIFRVLDLRAIPASWGRSFATLDNKMHKVQAVDDVVPSNMNSIMRQSDGYYRVIGDDPFIRFDISKLHLKGRDAGIISFDFTCKKMEGAPIIEIYWSSPSNSEGALTVVRLDGHNGRLIVPIDAMPAWLLAPHILSVRFDVLDRASCEAFKFENIRFLQRNSAY